jgi:hypothetical protein
MGGSSKLSAEALFQVSKEEPPLATQPVVVVLVEAGRALVSILQEAAVVTAEEEEATEG